MLEGLLTIQFTPEQNSKYNYYKVNEVKYLTLEFDEEMYFVGFLKSTEASEQYIFGINYMVEMIFPSINYELFNKFAPKLTTKYHFPICFGKKKIGISYFEVFEYQESSLDSFYTVIKSGAPSQYHRQADRLRLRPCGTASALHRRWKGTGSLYL